MNGTQSIDKPCGASVFGAASVEATPDLARLRVAIKQPKPGEAFEETRSAVNQVREVLRELEILETVLVDVVEAGANQVDGVEFDVGGKKQLRAQAREAAVAAAQAKAQRYAGAAGARLGPVVHIKDIDSERMQNTYRGHAQSAAAGGEGDLTPGKITVSAVVVLGFSLISD
jgi:uncharacterized protein YggE